MSFEAESREHRDLIQMMVNHYHDNGYARITADLDGFTQPEEIDDFIPDVIADQNPNQPVVILEAETCESLNIQHTRDQWTAFDNRARRINGIFHAVVPNACFEEAQRLMAEWGLHGSVFTPRR